ncbi:hypothetical protein IMZ31_24370 (plasmid) [Pontibacillus sp. ALD_SL1]|uniref:hypothetical protein n=1 Tax=Pontibacillus sp. ALD_SL1 TaxID=2777185 RepID=UPI001A971527|nr:hypothetical protein [Pontibacillus sp. ALD_SL1]QST02589.1 hypothetical protein IMZ31_24370 [Pontibacillus sp. ALD_SL1]
MKNTMTSIRFTQAEGPITRAGETRTFTTWSEAEAHINDLACYAPSNGYYKCDFVILFEEGGEYRGRFDLDRTHVSGNPLSEHVLRELTFRAGSYRPPHMKEEVYRDYIRGGEEDAQAFLDTYQIGDAS